MIRSFGLDTSDADAVAGDIILNKTGYVNGSKITGNIVDQIAAGQVLTPSTADQAFPAGRYDGQVSSGKVLGDVDLIAAKIKNGENIFGVVGNFSSDADAVASDIKTPKTAYVNGTKITGNYTPLDTSDATAGVNSILIGLTAYVNGAKITGQYESLGCIKNLTQNPPVPSVVKETLLPNLSEKALSIPLPSVEYETLVS